MPQQVSFSTDSFVSGIDYSEAWNVLELTTSKQKQLRREQRQRPQELRTQLLLKRTYNLVCELLNSDCCPSSSSSSRGEIPTSSSCSSLPLSTVDTNKRKSSPSDDNDRPLKKSKSLMDKCFDITNDNDILQFLLELNAVKVAPRY